MIKFINDMDNEIDKIKIDLNLSLEDIKIKLKTATEDYRIFVSGEKADIENAIENINIKKLLELKNIDLKNQIPKSEYIGGFDIESLNYLGNSYINLLKKCRGFLFPIITIRMNAHITKINTYLSQLNKIDTKKGGRTRRKTKRTKRIKRKHTRNRIKRKHR